MEVLHVYTVQLGFEDFNDKCVYVKFDKEWNCFKFMDFDRNVLAIIPHDKVVMIKKETIEREF